VLRVGIALDLSAPLAELARKLGTWVLKLVIPIKVCLVLLGCVSLVVVSLLEAVVLDVPIVLHLICLDLLLL
jgi:hypothetical protein